MATEPSIEPGALSGPPVPLRMPASRDKRTGLCVFPEIPAHSPASPNFETIELSSLATLYSFTIIHPKGDAKPFALVYADFPEGARVFGRLDMPDGHRPEIGMAVAVEAGAALPYIFTGAQEAQS